MVVAVHPRFALGVLSARNADCAWTEGIAAEDGGLSVRDRRILELARSAPHATFAEAVRALHDAVVAVIPAGRIYVLGAAADGPIIGSLISGVGIAQRGRHVALVRVARDGEVHALGRFAP